MIVIKSRNIPMFSKMTVIIWFATRTVSFYHGHQNPKRPHVQPNDGHHLVRDGSNRLGGGLYQLKCPVVYLCFDWLEVRGSLAES